MLEFAQLVGHWSIAPRENCVPVALRCRSQNRQAYRRLSLRESSVLSTTKVKTYRSTSTSRVRMSMSWHVVKDCVARRQSTTGVTCHVRQVSSPRRRAVSMTVSKFGISILCRIQAWGRRLSSIWQARNNPTIKPLKQGLHVSATTTFHLIHHGSRSIDEDTPL